MPTEIYEEPEVEAVVHDGDGDEEEEEEAQVVVAVGADDDDEEEEQDDEDYSRADSQVDSRADSNVLAAEAEDDEDDEEEEDGDEVMAAVVVEDAGDAVAEDDDDDDEAAPVEAAVVVAETPKEPVKKKTKKKKSRPKPNPEPVSSSFQPDSNQLFAALVAPECVEAARDARAMLQETVQTLPFTLAETQVRSFGRLYVDEDVENPFATTSSLYPIGFSCDRYEFSPVHGRILKVRCSILDGRKIKQKQLEGDFDVSTDLGDGPVFRMMWGRGVDEDADSIEYPFEPNLASPPLTSDKIPALALADPSAPPPEPLIPDKGMRVKVRFEKDKYYCGTIKSVAEAPSKKKSRRVRQLVNIEYDAGSTEELVYPDPDVSLLLPGVEEEIDDDGKVELEELNGRPVTSVVGSSALETWGKALVKLGMIDEMMFDYAMDAVKKSREAGLQEAKDRLNKTAPTKSRDRSDSGVESSPPSPESAPPNGDAEEKKESPTNGDASIQVERPSEKEEELKLKAARLLKELETAADEDRDASVELADARIHLQGAFLCNPFQNEEQSKSQQVSWLATAVRKEKMKMGSTGNKKKVVTAVDLLERNDTLYSADIEALIEGLPGSEYCSSYIFQAFRTGGAATLNRSWVHEAQLRREKETLKRIQRSKEMQEREHHERERRQKRKHRDDLRDARKRQKIEEEDSKKRARTEDRLERLRLQVEERLQNEANFQREKAITTLARGMVKEFNRRKKAAETVAAQAVVESKGLSPKADSCVDALPSLASIYDEDVLRVWNFMTTFGSFFVERGYVSEIPTLASLQTAVDSLRNKTASGKLTMSTADAVSSLTELAVALCKPLAASLTRVLFASLIALNPTLQKDFGAAFFNEVNATASAKDESDESHPDVLLPVNAMTWQEIARSSLLSDALGELGYQRHEAAHVLRGYRSAGHPNSKEARRLRKAEDFWIALVRQQVDLGNDADEPEEGLRCRVDIPCNPLCGADDFVFYLHIIRSNSNATLPEVKRSLSKALKLTEGHGDKFVAECKEDLRRLLQLIDECGSKSDNKTLRKVKSAVSAVFEKVAGPASNRFAEDAALGKADQEWPWAASTSAESTAGDLSADGELRQRMGLLNSLSLSKSSYKKLTQDREVYMEEALHLKELEKRKQAKEDDDEDEDEDEDDEEDGENGSSHAEIVASPQKEGVAATNGDVTGNKTTGMGQVGVAGTSVADATTQDTRRIGKPTEFDEFCGDIPTAPETIRRCLAVLRTLCLTSQAAIFLDPVDPQSNPGYYDTVLRPMCLREIGRQLRAAAEAIVTKTESGDVDAAVEAAVVQFGRNVRLMEQNTRSYANAGPTVISMGSELLRIFERLLLDWVLAPDDLLPPLNQLDDDKCVDCHSTDEESTVLFCDGCEGKYNISRLNPPMLKVPKGDWYCQRCVDGRWWGSLDPRVRKVVRKVTTGQSGQILGPEATVLSCLFRYSEARGGSPTLMYRVRLSSDKVELWSLEEVDRAMHLSNIDVPPIRCLKAVAESPGYGAGIDLGLRSELVPVPLHPNISDAAAQVALSSSVFRDTISASGTLLVIDPKDMTAKEWLRLLVLLTMKCSSSDVIQTVVTKMETKAAEMMQEELAKAGKVSTFRDILPDLPFSTEDEEALGTVVEPHVTDAAPVVLDDIDTKSSDSVENGVHDGAIIEASAVEVVPENEASSSAVAMDVDGPKATEVVEKAPVFAQALLLKRRRRKAVEDGFSGYCVKSQLKTAVASFEEDSISQVVDGTFKSKFPGLNFATMRCRRMLCSLCGLSDVALGTPLVRVPDGEEWMELIPHTVRGRRVQLVAELPSLRSSSTRSTKLVSVKIHVDGELMSILDTDLEDTKEGGMLEFLPKAEEGFQDELLFRDETGLPFVTGSLSAHECCAISAHNSRSDLLVQRHKEQQADLVEKTAGLTCGRTLEIGRDDAGRSYWKFNGDLDALFVCERSSEAADTSALQWLRFGDADWIASVIVSLGKSSIAKELRRSYPEAEAKVKDRSWANALLKRRFGRALAAHAGDDDDVEMNDVREKETALVIGGFEPYEIGEEVLVESKSGHLFWDAVVTGVSKRAVAPSDALVIDAYRVEYTGWSTRFTEWVEPNRVVEPNENNRLLQEEMQTEREASRCGLPTALNMLAAKDYLYARDRARGDTPLPDFARIAQVDVSSTSSVATLAMMKAAMLAVEASLPVGCLDSTENGVWGRRYADKWRQLVKDAEGPARLMQCVILLEDLIHEDWIKEDVGHLRSCLPARWKAITECSSASLAIRVILLDRSINYGMIDRKRFGNKKKR